MTIQRLRDAGFTVRLIEGDKIEIAPASKLTDAQLEWLKEHKSGLVAELRAPLNASPDPLHWPRCITLCTSKGATREEEEVQFRKEDIDDLCQQSVDDLPAFADPLVAAIKRERIADDVVVPIARAYRTRHHRGSCSHYRFKPTTGSCGLGWCNARRHVGMALSSREIECEQYQQRTSNDE